MLDTVDLLSATRHGLVIYWNDTPVSAHLASAVTVSFSLGYLNNGVNSICAAIVG